METKNDVLHFLNKRHFADYIECDDHKKTNCIKIVLTDEFQDVNSEKLINMLSVFDDLYIGFMTQYCRDVRILTNVLRSDKCLLRKEKMLSNN